MHPEDESQPTDSNLPEETIVDPVAVVTNADNSDTSESATKTEISESKIQESSLDVMQDSTTVQPILESSVQQVTDAQPSISPAATPEEPIPQPPVLQSSIPLGATSTNVDDADVSPFKDPSFKTRFASFFKMVRLKGNAARAQNKQKKMDKIVDLAAKHGSIVEKQIRLALRVSAAEASICLHELVVQGRLRHIGPMHAGKYEKM
jgi:hypothetical protein